MTEGCMENASLAIVYHHQHGFAVEHLTQDCAGQSLECLLNETAEFNVVLTAQALSPERIQLPKTPREEAFAIRRIGRGDRITIYAPSGKQIPVKTMGHSAFAAFNAPEAGPYYVDVEYTYAKGITEKPNDGEQGAGPLCILDHRWQRRLCLGQGQG